jgi:hypothetical protein
VPVFGQAPALGGCVRGISGPKDTQAQRGQPSGLSCKKKVAALVDENGQIASKTWNHEGTQMF